MFYLGEIILLKECQGQGIGAEMYKRFEVFAQEKGYPQIVFCEFVRDFNRSSTRLWVLLFRRVLEGREDAGNALVW
jgi:predicted GNAT superfamily acetyltransferase